MYSENATKLNGVNKKTDIRPKHFSTNCNENLAPPRNSEEISTCNMNE